TRSERRIARAEREGKAAEPLKGRFPLRAEVPKVTKRNRHFVIKSSFPQRSTGRSMAFSFLQRGSLSEYARDLKLSSYEPSLVLEGLVTGIDNLRHDVFLSPRFSESARLHIFKLIARHGNVEDLASEEPRPGRLGGQTPARVRERQAI